MLDSARRRSDAKEKEIGTLDMECLRRYQKVKLAPTFFRQFSSTFKRRFLQFWGTSIEMFILLAPFLMVMIELIMIDIFIRAISKSFEVAEELQKEIRSTVYKQIYPFFI